MSAFMLLCCVHVRLNVCMFTGMRLFQAQPELRVQCVCGRLSVLLSVVMCYK